MAALEAHSREPESPELGLGGWLSGHESGRTRGTVPRPFGATARSFVRTRNPRAFGSPLAGGEACLLTTGHQLNGPKSTDAKADSASCGPPHRGALGLRPRPFSTSGLPAGALQVKTVRAGAGAQDAASRWVFRAVFEVPLTELRFLITRSAERRSSHGERKRLRKCLQAQHAGGPTSGVGAPTAHPLPEALPSSGSAPVRIGDQNVGRCCWRSRLEDRRVGLCPRAAAERALDARSQRHTWCEIRAGLCAAR